MKLLHRIVALVMVAGVGPWTDGLTPMAWAAPQNVCTRASLANSIQEQALSNPELWVLLSLARDQRSDRINETRQYLPDPVGDPPFAIRFFYGMDRTPATNGDGGWGGPGSNFWSSGVEAADPTVFLLPGLTHHVWTALAAGGLIREMVIAASIAQGPTPAARRRVAAAIDKAQMLDGKTQLIAGLAHLAGPHKDYQPLVDYVNHVLENRGHNPRNPFRGPQATIESAQDIQSVDLWAIKEGLVCHVFQAEVLLRDGRKMRWVLNIGKDLTEVPKIMAQTYEGLADNYRTVPESTMEPYGFGVGRVMTRFGLRDVPVMVGEWLDNTYELHLDAATGTRFRVWVGDPTTAPVLDEKASDDIWRQITQYQVQTVHFDGSNSRGTVYSLASGDFVGRWEGGHWKPYSIWNSGPVHGHAISTLLAAFMTWSKEADVPESIRTLWDKPEQALDAVYAGLTATYQRLNPADTSGAEKAANRALRYLVWFTLYHGFPQIFADPQTAHITPQDWGAGLRKALIRAAHVMRLYLRQEFRREFAATPLQGISDDDVDALIRVHDQVDAAGLQRFTGGRFASDLKDAQRVTALINRFADEDHLRPFAEPMEGPLIGISELVPTLRAQVEDILGGSSYPWLIVEIQTLLPKIAAGAVTVQDILERWQDRVDLSRYLARTISDFLNSTAPEVRTILEAA